MTSRTRRVPEQEFERIANTPANLVKVAASLDKMASELETTDAEQAKRLRAEMHRILDSADAISESVLVSTKLTAA